MADQNLSSEEMYRQARQLYIKVKSFNIYGWYDWTQVFQNLWLIWLNTFFQAEKLEEGHDDRRELEGKVTALCN